MRMYPQSTKELQERQRALAPKQLQAFQELGQQVFAEGALSTKVKQLIAVAVAHTTQCPYSIRYHSVGALRSGASAAEIMEAIWVAADMRAGAAYAHSTIALEVIQEHGPTGLAFTRSE